MRMAQHNAIWVKYLCLMFLLRMLVNIIGIEISLEYEFDYLIYLIPLFIFLFCWQHIVQVYMSFKPMLISLGIAVIFGIVLSFY